MKVSLDRTNITIDGWGLANVEHRLKMIDIALFKAVYPKFNLMSKANNLHLTLRHTNKVQYLCGVWWEYLT